MLNRRLCCWQYYHLKPIALRTCGHPLLSLLLLFFFFLCLSLSLFRFLLEPSHRSHRINGQRPRSETDKLSRLGWDRDRLKHTARLRNQLWLAIACRLVVPWRLYVVAARCQARHPPTLFCSWTKAVLSFPCDRHMRASQCCHPQSYTCLGRRCRPGPW